MNFLTSYKPALPRNILLLVSGVMWSLVGVMLIIIACSWYRGFALKEYFLFFDLPSVFDN